MEKLPLYIGIVFGLTTILTVFMFNQATNRSSMTLPVLIGWMAFQSMVSFSGFYTFTNSIPPRFLLLVGPPFLFIVLLFVTTRGRQFLDRLDTARLTLLHVIRIPVEIVLLLLFLNKTVPQLMTFEGRNFDILSGISAPLIYYFGYVKKQLSSWVMLTWNFICLALLLNIVINAALSTPYPFQQFGFEQPNVAVLYFPFVWLPGCIVPLVLLSHLATIRKLMMSKGGIVKKSLP